MMCYENSVHKNYTTNRKDCIFSSLNTMFKIVSSLNALNFPVEAFNLLFYSQVPQ